MSGNYYISEAMMKISFKKSNPQPVKRPTVIPNLITVEEAAERYGCSVSSIYKGTMLRKFPSYRFGHRSFFKAEELDKYFLRRQEAVK